MTTIECLWNLKATLGEGPVWSARDAALWFVDIKNPRILRYGIADGATRELPMPAEIGCIAPRRRGGFVAALRTGLAFVDADTGAVTPIVDPEADRAANRFNDGKCDPAGRFWAGSMDDACAAPTGVLYRLDPDLTLTAMDDGYAVTNGPAFSPDGRILYENASVEHRIWAFDCDPDTGALANKRVFAQLEPGCCPDGAAVDADGCLWVAVWGGGCVLRYTPDGAVDRRIDVPAVHTTSVAFGGDGYRTLFITSAREGRSDAQLRAEPLAGGLFAVEAGVVGLPPAEFGG